MAEGYFLRGDEADEPRRPAAQRRHRGRALVGARPAQALERGRGQRRAGGPRVPEAGHNEQNDFGPEMARHALPRPGRPAGQGTARDRRSGSANQQGFPAGPVRARIGTARTAQPESDFDQDHGDSERAQEQRSRSNLQRLFARRTEKPPREIHPRQRWLPHGRGSGKSDGLENLWPITSKPQSYRAMPNSTRCARSLTPVRCEFTTERNRPRRRRRSRRRRYSPNSP